jgi:8-oxo-dGTP pyrophosphatase MutT (NUDIX family)
MTDSTRNPWRTLASETVYDNPWIAVSHHRVLTPRAENGIYGTVHFKNRAVGVLPIDAEGHTWLVGQYRYALNAYSWEIPEGGAPAGDELVDAARRELREETGLHAESFRELCRMHLSNSVTDEAAVAYLATGLTQGEAEPEPTEELAVKRLPFAQAYAMVLRGEITDAISVAAILRAQLLFAGL